MSTTTPTTTRPAPEGFHFADPANFPKMITADFSIKVVSNRGLTGEDELAVDLYVDPGDVDEGVSFGIGNYSFTARDAERLADALHALVKLNRARLAR